MRRVVPLLLWSLSSFSRSCGIVALANPCSVLDVHHKLSLLPFLCLHLFVTLIADYKTISELVRDFDWHLWLSFGSLELALWKFTSFSCLKPPCCCWLYPSELLISGETKAKNPYKTLVGVFLLADSIVFLFHQNSCSGCTPCFWYPPEFLIVSYCI